MFISDAWYLPFHYSYFPYGSWSLLKLRQISVIVNQETRIMDSVFASQKPRLWRNVDTQRAHQSQELQMNLDDIKRQTQAPSSFLMQREYNARTKLVLQQFDLVVSCIVPRAALHVCRVVLAFRRLSPCHCICTHHISCLLVCFVRGPGPLCRAEASCWVSCLRRCPFPPKWHRTRARLIWKRRATHLERHPSPQELFYIIIQTSNLICHFRRIHGMHGIISPLISHILRVSYVNSPFFW